MSGSGEESLAVFWRRARRLVTIGQCRVQSGRSGYLRGRIKGYRKGNVPRASVLNAIQMAQDYKVPTADILALLQAAGLAYDFKTRKLVDRR
jgi:hypothetical protein